MISDSAPKYSTSPRRRLVPWLAIVLIQSIMVALMLGTTYVQSRNSLYENGRWISSKTQLDRFVMGAFSYVVTRVGLQLNRLNLSSWHGFQEVLYHEPLALKTVRFDCLIPAKSYMSFVFDKDEVGFSGFRLSRHEAFPSIYFSASTAGQFLNRTNLEVPGLRDGWNRAEFTFGDRQVAFSLNGQPQGSFPCGPLRAAFCGFRGCLHNAAVDNVRIEQQDSPDVITESFDNFHSLSPVLVPLLAVLLGINALLVLGLLRWVGPARTGPILVTLNGWMIMGAVIVLGMELVYYAPQYPRSIDYTPFVKLRGVADAAPARAAIVKEIHDLYPNREPDKKRILCIGTSQTWGAGARKIDETWVRRIETRLNQEAAASGPYECINGGISGSHSTELLDVYKTEWLSLEPQAVVINLTFNDNNPQTLAQNVRQMIELGRARKIPTLIVLEPSCMEYEDGSIQPKREALRSLGVREQVPVLDMNAYLVQHHDDGFIWWDFIHLTSFGQRLFADRLYLEVHKLLSGSPGAPEAPRSRPSP